MLGYGKSYIIHGVYSDLKKKLHYTDKQMCREFPCLVKKLESEILTNLEKTSTFTINKVVKIINKM